MKTEMNKVTRIVKLLNAIQSGHPGNADCLAAVLQICRRTIYRDLDDLQKAGVQIRYDSSKKRYVIETGVFLPSKSLSAQEALALVLLIYKAKEQLSLPFNNLAVRAAEKIKKSLPSEMEKYCDKALENILVKNCQPIKTDVFDWVFLELRQAISEMQAVKISYSLYDGQNPVEAELHPYQLACVHNVWYVVGKTQRGEIRTFNLNRVVHVTLLDKFFVKDKKFKVDEYLNRAWAVRPEGTLYHVKLRFEAEIAASVAEVKWHSSQVVTFAADSSVIVEFRIDGLNEIIPWVLGYGDKVRVIGPEALRREIIRINQQAAKQNGAFDSATIQ